MLNRGIKFEKFGVVEKGNYNLVLDDIIFKEKVFSIVSKNIPDALMKVIRNKEMKDLTEDQVRQLESIDLGQDGLFENGQVKPRWQNRTVFVFHDEHGNGHNVELYGGPKLNKSLTEFIEGVFQIKIDAIINKEWDTLFKVGDKFTAFIDVVNNFNRVKADTVRKEGLAPVSGGATSSDMSQTAKALLKYLQGEGKGMNTGDIAQLYSKNITIDGITLNDNGAIMLAFGEIKTKVKQYQIDGKINIVLK